MTDCEGDKILLNFMKLCLFKAVAILCTLIDPLYDAQESSDVYPSSCEHNKRLDDVLEIYIITCRYITGIDPESSFTVGLNAGPPNCPQQIPNTVKRLRICFIFEIS